MKKEIYEFDFFAFLTQLESFLALKITYIIFPIA